MITELFCPHRVSVNSLQRNWPKYTWVLKRNSYCICKCGTHRIFNVILIEQTTLGEVDDNSGTDCA